MRLSLLVAIAQMTWSRFQLTLKSVLLQLFIQVLVERLELIIVAEAILAHFVLGASQTINKFTAGTLLRFPGYKFATSTNKDLVNSKDTTIFFQWVNLNLNILFDVAINR